MIPSICRENKVPKQVFIIRQYCNIRAISQEEVVEALPTDEKVLERQHFEVDSTDFSHAVDQGDWRGQDHFLREAAADVRSMADASAEASLHYFAMAEVPQMIAFGAHLGNERAIMPHDHIGEAGPWNWPDTEQTIDVVVNGMEPLATTISAPGPAVVRVALSYAIQDADVRAVVGDGTVADLTITLANMNPARNSVRSLHDVNAARQAFCDVYARLLSSRPNADVIHLFVAAPPSVCFAIGQELVLRNGKPVQTYRYRANSGDQPAQQAAILLSSISTDQPPPIPLSDQDVVIAGYVRQSVWKAALVDLDEYRASLLSESDSHGRWFDGFVYERAMSPAAPFPALPPLAVVAPTKVSVDPESFAGEFGFESERRLWRLNDRLLLGIHQAAGQDDARLRQLIRLFLFHEYVHLHHSLNKYNVDEVGKFANCLEHIDYTADTYALLHQLDLAAREDAAFKDFEPARAFLADQIELAIQSFWAFDQTNGNEWQVRRIRRYLNWYWRHVQVVNANTFPEMMSLFGRQPRIEIGGLYQVASGRRVFALLNRLDADTFLELAIVMEDEKLFRLTSGPNTNLHNLIDSFRSGDHDQIKQFFRAVYALAEGHGSSVQSTPKFQMPPIS